MTMGRKAAWTAGIAVALPLALACGKLPRVEYALPGAALVPYAAAGIEDRSAEFGAIFCTVLAHAGAEGGPWGGCSDYIEAPGPPGVDLPPVPTDLRVLVVPGILAQCFSPGLQAFSDAFAHLREKHGVTAEYLDVPALGSCEQNAAVVAGHLRQAIAADARKFIVVGYSKGACDVMTALVSFPEVREAVAALVTLAGPVGGSRVPDLTAPWMARFMDRKVSERCDRGDGGGLESLRRPVRQAFLRENPVPIVPTYSLVAVSGEENTSRGLRSFWKKLSMISRDQDGQVIASEGIPPGARFLGVLRGDHWAIAMPFELRDEDSFLRKLGDQNHFPRTALLEAVFRLVASDLRAQPSKSSQAP